MPEPGPPPATPYSLTGLGSSLADEVVTGGNGDGAGHFARTRAWREVAPGERRTVPVDTSFSAVTFTGLTVITGLAPSAEVPGLA